MDPWWSETVSNTIGSIGGASVGVIFGGIGGGIGGPLAGRGKAKGFVLGMFWSAIVLGALLLLAAIVAALLGQPFHVWQWMLICGLVMCVVGAGVMPALRHAYRVAEERKLAAAELRRA